MFRSFLLLLKDAFIQWQANRAPKMGAALSFYAVFSLAPLAILLMSLVSFVVGRDAARAELVGRFKEFVGNEGAQVLEMILAKTVPANSSLLGTIVGFVVMFVGASGVFGELQSSLNQIWNVTPKHHPLLVIIKEHIFSFLMVLFLGVLMLISFLLSATSAAAGSFFHERFPELDGPWEAGNALISLFVIAILFALIFRIVPDTIVEWKDVWLGSILTSVFFVLGKFILGFYFGRSAVASSYGAAGSLIILLVWIFYSAQILFFGAEFTRAFATRFGSQRKRKASTECGERPI